MKYLLALAIIGLACGEASAISRYQTMRMDCADVQAGLRREGAAILRWQSPRNPSLPLYGRYVSDRRFCEFGEVTTFASVPTRDDPSCDVRKCVRPDTERFPRIIIPHD